MKVLDLFSGIVPQIAEIIGRWIMHCPGCAPSGEGTHSENTMEHGKANI